MKTTTYICDICNKSVSENELTTLKVNMEARRKVNPNSTSSYNLIKTSSRDICFDCLKKKGIIPKTFLDPKEPEETEKNNTKTMEDKFIEILSDLGVQFID